MKEFTAATVDMSIDQGDDETLLINRKQSDGSVKNIDGYTFWWTIKESLNDSDNKAEIQKEVTTHVDAVNGESKIELVPSDTEDLMGTYHYDVQEKTDDGKINTLIRGRLYIREDVTEAT